MSKISLIEKTQLKPRIVQVKPGDTVRVHQVIREGNKKRNQVFEGMVLKVSKPKEVNGSILVRKIASGVGVEKSWLLNSPNVTKVDVIKRSKVRRAYLTYLRERRGKSARLIETEFNHELVNVQSEPKDEVKKPTKDIDESQLVDESTEDLEKEENRQARADDESSDQNDDEQELAKEETQSGIDKAEDQVKNK